jgi:YfiH family protein
MLLRTQKDLLYFQFRAFCEIEGLRHGIFTRIGGKRRGGLGGGNLARSVGDAAATVDANRKLLADLFAPGTLYFTHQTHGSQVQILDGGPPPTADALVSDRAGNLAVIQVADCQAILLVDPRRRVVANIHSGWRGSVANIVGETVGILTGRCGCRPADLLAGIGPSLGPCCGEFRHFREELPPEVWSYGNKNAFFDFWTLSRDQLIAAGVPRGQIHQSRICTRCNTGLFYSYRANPATGRFAAVIGFET